MGSGMVGSEAKGAKKIAVKSEDDESPEIQLGSLQKRPKLDFFPQSNSVPEVMEVPSGLYNPLDEPSPLGLRLKKSPSLLDLIQMKLSRGNVAKMDTVGKKGHKGSATSGSGSGSGSGSLDKLKASNFPASILRIGSWEYKSRYEGDLVAKCYFAKHKLVWEVLDGSLKNKIEIQWSDIVALKASYPDNAPGTLNVVLARQPLFFRETNPQPRKHTLWQATSDFTGGQASLHRQHFLQCPQGLLGKHFEKLVQCDPRLNFLSQQPEIVLDSPFFEPRVTAINGSTNEFSHGFDTKGENGPSYLGLQDAVPQLGALSSSKTEQEFSGVASENYAQDIPSPSSVVDAHAIEEIKSLEVQNSKLLRNLDQIKVPGLHPSMSMSDLVNHIGNCISENMTSGNPLFNGKQQQHKEMLEEIAQYLFNDSQNSVASDEKCLMSRVNSLCCLLQKDSSVAQNLQGKSDDGFDINGARDTSKTNFNYASENKVTRGFPASSKRDSNDVSADCKQAQAMSRKDSFGDLLLSLPRIASLPQFFVNLSQDSDNQAR